MTVLIAPKPDRTDADRPSLVAVAQVRLMVLMLLFIAGMGAVLICLLVLGLSTNPRAPRSAADALPPRADIVDRRGATLARTINGWTIGLRPNDVIGDKATLARRLAEVLPGRTAAQYLAMLNSRRPAYLYLRRNATPELVQQVNALGEPGIVFDRTPRRFYPEGTLAAHVLGYVNADGHGGQGMERVLDAELIDPARRGNPVPLSIDLRVQAVLEQELGSAMRTFRAQGAAGIVLDVNTGEVMAMASLPEYNPNAVPSEPPLNRVTQARYELGSTFKPITAAAAMERGVVTSMARRFDATEPLRIGRFTIRDDHPQRRFLNVPEMLVYSSNIVTARIGEMLGREGFEDIFRRLHFDRPAEIEIPAGRTLWPAGWSRATLMTVGYGHGISVSPLHLAQAYAALVNGGVWHPSTLRRVAPGARVPGERVVSEQTSTRMRQLLRLVVTDGTGHFADVPGFRVGGKTGTAEKEEGGGYSANKNISTFAAAFPMDAPRYVVVVMLDSPVGNDESAGQRTAGWTATPIVARVIQRAGPMLGVMPDPSRDLDVSELRALIWHPANQAAGEQ